MQLAVDYRRITEIFQNAHAEGRNFLFEYEVYNLLEFSGSETPPKYLFIPKNGRISEDEVLGLPGEKAVLKIVSPNIVHKTEVGGVCIAPKTMNGLRSAVRRMLSEVPERYADAIERGISPVPADYAGLRGDDLKKAIAADLRGVLEVEYMPPDSDAFGNELIVGLRRTREFGMVLSAGLGGTDTELYAERFRKGQAIVTALTEMTDGASFFELYRRTISWRKLAGLTRGQRRIVTDEQLIECFESFIRLGRHFSQANPHAPFIIDELEINPFAFTNYLMVPLDGLCRFSLPQKKIQKRPIAKIDNLLHPRTIGIAGVSATRRNFGRIILDNILKAGFKAENVTLIGKGEKEIAGCPVMELAKLPSPLDLLIIAVKAEATAQLVEDVLSGKAAYSVMLVSGGLGETEESRELAKKISNDIRVAHQTEDGGPVFLGANCMGVISRPGHYDTWFIPAAKMGACQKTADRYRRVAIFSQSGAFLLNRISQAPELRPAYLISMGNQTDLTLGDMMAYFQNSPEVDVIAVYAEGFKDLDGLAFAKGVRAAVEAGKYVIFYKAGRTPEGKNATSGHTASIAGDYMVCENCIREAGAMIARNFTEFQDLILLADSFHDIPVKGRALGCVSGAGFEAVGMADSILSDDYSMTFGELAPKTREGIAEILAAKNLQHLVNIANPMDINPGADDEAHARVTELMLLDNNIDAVIAGLDPHSPVTHTLADAEDVAFRMDAQNGILAKVAALRSSFAKPLAVVVDGGNQFEPLRQALLQNDIPVFEVCDRAVSSMSQYLEGRLRANAIREAARQAQQG